jgi:hypothetical protein
VLTEQDINDVLYDWSAARNHPRWRGRLTPPRRPAAYHFGKPVFVDRSAVGIEQGKQWIMKALREWNEREYASATR